jgi:hypothetical protein
MTPRAPATHLSAMRVLQTAALVCLAATVLAQPAPDLDRVGPQPGTRVPDFTAVDQFGASRSLQSLLGPKGAMLVFSRSADW